ncbi:hypothetical protein NHQ30_005175 [Ciborinia camelliae]|nr:hypothetical protein NHQ30_005175 [Ciborinia camelliae]
MIRSSNKVRHRCLAVVHQFIEQLRGTDGSATPALSGGYDSGYASSTGQMRGVRRKGGSWQERSQEEGGIQTSAFFLALIASTEDIRQYHDTNTHVTATTTNATLVVEPSSTVASVTYIAAGSAGGRGNGSRVVCCENAKDIALGRGSGAQSPPNPHGEVPRRRGEEEGGGSSPNPHGEVPRRRGEGEGGGCVNTCSAVGKDTGSRVVCCENAKDIAVERGRGAQSSPNPHGEVLRRREEGMTGLIYAPPAYQINGTTGLRFVCDIAAGSFCRPRKLPAAISGNFISRSYLTRGVCWEDAKVNGKKRQLANNKGGCGGKLRKMK